METSARQNAKLPSVKIVTNGRLCGKTLTRKDFPVSELYFTITWLPKSSSISNQRMVIASIFIREWKKNAFKKNIPDTNICFQGFIEKYYFNRN